MSPIYWLVFVGATVVSYIGISWFAQMSGGSSSSALQAFLSGVRPAPLLLVVVSNMLFALAAYYGFMLTRHAIPIMISMGAITAFVYSTLVLGAQLSFIKAGGVLLVISGIVLMAI